MIISRSAGIDFTGSDAKQSIPSAYQVSLCTESHIVTPGKEEFLHFASGSTSSAKQKRAGERPNP